MIESLQSLIGQTGSRLKLRWLTPEPRSPRLLRGEDPGTSRQSLIGSLNCIHPNRLQVIGHAELLYLAGLGRTAYAETIDKLFSDRPTAVIFSDGKVRVTDDIPSVLVGAGVYHNRLQD